MISVIIPTYNEAATIVNLVQYLKKETNDLPTEIIVCDNSSIDGTQQLATRAGAILLQSPSKGRAAQMNFAASQASGTILYFVHADSFPPHDFVKDIEAAVTAGFDAGRYKTKFLSSKFLLKLNAFFTRFHLFSCYGGDQTLFITRSFFSKIGGFDESKHIMEDYDISSRIVKEGRYIIFPKPALISARKYEKNSWLTVQKANYTAVKMYRTGVDTQTILDHYRKSLRF
jgi:rSAM/selenodomain-associated transferase 2